MKRILSLGAGVQSSTLLLMSCRGELPKLDAAVFADTGWEPAAVYRHLDWLESEAERAGIRLVRLTGRNIKEDALKSQVRGKKTNGSRWASMPYFTLGPDGSRGMIRRQCTKEYKLERITRWLKEKLLGYKRRARMPTETLIDQWIGISTDESHRAREAREHWILVRWPLIDHGMTRRSCLMWCESHRYSPPPRSACIGCPFHHNSEWREMKRDRPKEFEDACQFDDAIRKCGGMRGDVFLHASRIPLRDVDFSIDIDRGQGTLFEVDRTCPHCWT